MRDDNEDERTRLDAAKAAAPYCHARLASMEVSGPNGAPVAGNTTNVLVIPDDMTIAELDVLERALRKSLALMEATQ
jgi:hypothetical protein